MQLAYSRHGNGNHKKILLLHGMGGTGALWRPITAALEDEFDLLAPDQRGHGGSQIPHVPGSRDISRYTPLDYGQDVIDTMESLDFHPAYLIGHSMGVRTACAAAHLRRDWALGLILVDLGFSGPAGGGLGDGLAQFLRLLPPGFDSREGARAFMRDHCPDPSIGQYLLAVSKTTSEGKLTFPFDHAALIETIEATRAVSVRRWLQELAQAKMPILVLRGAESQVWSREEFLAEENAFAGLGSVRFQEIPGAGHGLPFEKRAEFVALIREFAH